MSAINIVGSLLFLAALIVNVAVGTVLIIAKATTKKEYERLWKITLVSLGLSILGFSVSGNSLFNMRVIAVWLTQFSITGIAYLLITERELIINLKKKVIIIPLFLSLLFSVVFLAIKISGDNNNAENINQPTQTEIDSKINAPAKINKSLTNSQDSSVYSSSSSIYDEETFESSYSTESESEYEGLSDDLISDIDNILKDESLIAKDIFVDSNYLIVQIDHKDSWDVDQFYKRYVTASSHLLERVSSEDYTHLIISQEAVFDDKKGNSNTQLAISSLYSVEMMNEINYSNWMTTTFIEPSVFFELSDAYYINLSVYDGISNEYLSYEDNDPIIDNAKSIDDEVYDKYGYPI